MVTSVRKIHFAAEAGEVLHNENMKGMLIWLEIFEPFSEQTNKNLKYRKILVWNKWGNYYR